MAEKRMFAKKVTDSDAFIEMSSAAQALYFHLNQAADDDGFNNQIQISMMKAHASVDDLKVLMMKRFIIRFENGVIVIKHWRMHNTLRKDRYTPTAFQEEMALLKIKDNLSYTLEDDGCQTVAKRLPQNRLDKIRLEESIGGAAPAPPTPVKDEKHRYGQYGWVKLTDAEHQRLIADFGERVASHYISYVDESAEQTGNKNKWKNWNLTVRKAIRDKWGGGVPESGGWKEFD